MYRILACLMLLVLPCSAQMNAHLKEEFHDSEAYGVAVVETLSGLRSALQKPETRVISFQSFNEEVTPEAVSELLAWVRAGHTVWFYDARLAPLFGMKPVFISAENFRTKPEEGVLGGKKRNGVATVAVSIGSHAVQTGVGQVTLFLPNIEGATKKEVTYGAIELEGDTIALLQLALESPALVAARRDGRGFIVFKSLLWNEPLSGDRFQGNLLEFSAGYQVPGPAGVGKVGHPPGPEAEFVAGQPAVPLTPPDNPANSSSLQEEVSGTEPVEIPAKATLGMWTALLQDGTSVAGKLESKWIEFETGESSLKLAPDEVNQLEMGSSVRLDRIVTAKGVEKTGLLLTSPLRIRTERGVEEFEKEDIVKLSRSLE